MSTGPFWPRPGEVLVVFLPNSPSVRVRKDDSFRMIASSAVALRELRDARRIDLPVAAQARIRLLLPVAAELAPPVCRLAGDH
jgi:hypothetical protein